MTNCDHPDRKLAYVHVFSLFYGQTATFRLTSNFVCIGGCFLARTLPKVSIASGRLLDRSKWCFFAPRKASATPGGHVWVSMSTRFLFMRTANILTLALATILLSAALVGCTPSVSPLFRDFEVRAAADDPGLIREALEAAGWSIAPDTTSSYLRTLPRRFNERGIAASEVELEIVPMARQHVRVFIYAQRVYFFGHRGTLPYLSSGLRDRFVPQLSQAFGERGMVLVTDTVDGR
jgi:hypothetical protein